MESQSQMWRVGATHSVTNHSVVRPIESVSLLDFHLQSPNVADEYGLLPVRMSESNNPFVRFEVFWNSTRPSTRASDLAKRNCRRSLEDNVHSKVFCPALKNLTIWNICMTIPYQRAGNSVKAIIPQSTAPFEQSWFFNLCYPQLENVPFKWTESKRKFLSEYSFFELFLSWRIERRYGIRLCDSRKSIKFCSLSWINAVSRNATFEGWNLSALCRKAFFQIRNLISVF
jgi:hypothetical protein